MVKIVNIKFRGIDGWSRIIFKDITKNDYYGTTNILFPDYNRFPSNTIEEVIQYFKDNTYLLEYFGDHFDCEPLGGLDKDIELNIVTT